MYVLKRPGDFLVLCAAAGESSEDEFGFVGLHNISKHVIYL